MTVFLMDLDWMFDKSEIPNINCVKLSSFHKQRKDSVYLVNDISELTLSYDKLYIFSDSDSTPTPSPKILNDPNTVLLGKRFELCGGKRLGSVIMGCRPDYLLYDTQNDSYTKANFVTFFTDNGERIQQKQNWKNTKKGIKRTIITDNVLWRQEPEIVAQCLETLKDEKNIVFLSPISIKFLIDNYSVREKFFALNFSRGTKFKWRNDVGNDSDSALLISSFINELRKHTKSNIGSIPLNALEDNETIWEEDFKKLLGAIAIFKKNKIKCFFPPAKIVKHKLILNLINWCEKGIENSFIEEMVFFNAAKRGKRWFQIINDPRCWTDTRTREIISLLSEEKWKEFLPQMSVQWGDNSIDYTCIDFKIINDNAYLIT